MRPTLLILAVAATLTTTRPAPACGYGMPSPVDRFALADCVLVGKAIAVEGRTLRLQTTESAAAEPYTVVVLRVGSMLKGDDRLTHIRVAVQQHQVIPVGFEACFFLTAHPDDAVHTMSSGLYDYPIPRTFDAAFDAQMDRYRKMGELLRDPVAGLRSANAEDRFLTAAMLIGRYRTFNPRLHVAATKTEPIPEHLSPLILRALAEPDWNFRVEDFRLTPWRLFHMLGATPDDGLAPFTGQTPQENWDAARRWMKEHERTFVIKTFVHR